MRTAISPMGVNMSGIGFPNWGDAQAKAWGVLHQANSNGYILAGMNGASSPNISNSQRCYLYVGNTTTPNQQVAFCSGQAGTSTAFDSVFIPIKKDTYYIAKNPINISAPSGQFITFYPCL